MKDTAVPMRPLTALRVVEIEGTIRGALVGRLLAGLGAQVTKFRPEPSGTAHVDTGFAAWELFTAGLDEDKTVVPGDWSSPQGRRELMAALRQADVLVEPEDDPAIGAEAGRLWPRLVRCSLTPYGRTGPLSGLAGAELTAQALSGVLSTNGFPDSPPVRGGVAAGDYAGAVFAAMGVLAALRQRDRVPGGVNVDVSVLDTLVFFSNAFLSQALAHETPKRMGNRHTSLAPWNTYPTSDGSVVICTSGDEHWARCQSLMGIDDDTVEHLSDVTSRVRHVDQVDALVSAWAGALTTAEVVQGCTDAGIPVGEVKLISRLVDEADQAGPASGYMPTSPLRGVSRTGSVQAPTAASASASTAATAPAQVTDGPLAGVRVLELAGYTAGPFCGRILAGLGAEVVKIESLEGESVRRWNPKRAGEGMFFRLNNAGKKSLGIDLKTGEGRGLVERLVGQSDVVLSNFAPGVMDRLGFSAESVATLNSEAVSCFITGFGSQGPMAGRPAMDTVIQAEAGIMSVTGLADEPPVKFGISLADLMGSCVAALAIAAALAERDRVGSGAHLDVSMRDSMVWLTEMYWALARAGESADRLSRAGNEHPLFLANDVVSAEAGLVAVGVESEPQLRRLCSLLAPDLVLDDIPRKERRTLLAELLRGWAGARTMKAVVSALQEAGVPVAPVLHVTESILHPQVVAREVLGSALVGDEEIPLVNGPLRWSFGPEQSGFIGPVGADTEEVLTLLLGLDESDLSGLRTKGVIR